MSLDQPTPDIAPAGPEAPFYQKAFDDAVKNNPYFAAGGGLMVLGSGLAVARSSIKQLSLFAYRSMLVNLELTSSDKLYSWFLEWMSRYKDRRSRDLSVTTVFKKHDNGSVTTRFSLLPGPGNHWIKYKGAYMYVRREKSTKMIELNTGSPYETVSLTTLYRDRHLFYDLLEEARTMALKREEGKTVVYTAWANEWRPFGLPRKKRMVESVVLDKGVAEGILHDVEDFLDSGKWYFERGIPYRRGYLLYGPPGSGKTSFIQALAGKLDYNICILNLAEGNLTDDRLLYLMNKVPERSILLLEDIDAAALSRTGEETNSNQLKITFSGLLNAIDGVGSAEELITFMTTNHPEKLDPAILRPGRVDYKVLIDNASEYQILKMFMKFYGNNENAQQLQEEFVGRVKLLNMKISPAQLQGLFVRYKDDPHGAIREVGRLHESIKEF